MSELNQLEQRLMDSISFQIKELCYVSGIYSPSCDLIKGIAELLKKELESTVVQHSPIIDAMMAAFIKE